MGGINQKGRDNNYLITENSEPAELGSSIGWLLQLDGDEHRNAFLNSPWVKAVIPIRPGMELQAINWIEKSKVKISPQQFNLVRGQPRELTVTFEGLNEGPGVYSGNLLLVSPNLITVKIPITISIHADPLIALSLVGLLG